MTCARGVFDHHLQLTVQPELDQQICLSMQFLSLPPEIRSLIYHQFLTENTQAQHVSLLWKGFYARYPCRPLPDDSFLQDLSNSYGENGWGNYLAVKRFSSWRDGHLACEPNTLCNDGERLPSPTALFLTCRQIYQEAAVYLYTPLIFQSKETFEACLGHTRGTIPAGLTSVTLIESKMIPWFKFNKAARRFSRRLARLGSSDLSRISIKAMRSHPLFAAGLLAKAMDVSTRGCCREKNVEIVSASAGKAKTMKFGEGHEFTIRPDATWMRVLHRLESSGRKDLLDQLVSYDMLMAFAEDLGLT
ncbi:hypothetical protein PG990_010627 [Apiospora arundinis]